MKLVTHKSKNLLYRILPANNCTVDFRTSYAIATQTSADTNTNIQYKCQYRKDGTYLRDVFDNAFITSTGKITRTFTTPADLDYNTIMFGLNGAATDTLVAFLIKLKPSTTYTFTCNFTNITQGSISWKDMMLAEGSTAGDYEPYSYNLLDKNQFLGSNSNYINNGDGSITTTGIAFSFQRLFMDFDSDESSSISKEDSIAYLTYGHKLLINDNGNSTGTNWSNAAGYVWELNSISANGGGSYSGNGEIFTNNKLPLADIRRSYFYMKNNGGEVVTCKPTLYDLTLMYGAGKEPTTVDQFYADHPELKVSPLGFIGLKNLEISNKNIKRSRYKTTTRNLFDFSLLTDYKGIVGGYNAKYLQLKPNTTYTISTTNSNYYSDVVGTKGYAKLVNSDNSEITFIGHNTITALCIYPGHSITFTTDGVGKIGVAFNNVSSSEETYKQFYEEWFANMQIEEGSTATSYVPYGYLDLGIIPSNSGYVIEEFSNLSEELLKENVEINNVTYHIPDKTNILLNKVEGKTNKIVQLADKSKYDGTSTNRGITFANNGNGTITINGTNDGTDYSDHPITNSNYLTNDWLKGRKYLFYFSDRTDLNYYAVIGGSTSKMEYTELGNTSTGRSPLWKILSPTDNSIGGNSWYILRVKQNATCTNELASPQVLDLTSMYGFGNEPTTVEQFKKDYPQFFDEKLDGIWNVKTSGISTTGKNLFDISKWIYSPYDVANGTLVERLSNGAICQGDNGAGDGDARYSNGWFHPMNGSPYSNQVHLKAGIYTLSADYTMIENSVVSTTQVFCHLYGDNNYPGSAFTSAPVGSTVKVKNTYTVEEGHYYPIFTLNSGKAKIENIQIELNSTATIYEPYTENKIDLLSIQTLNGINGVNDYIEVIDKGNGLYDLKKTQNIASVNMGSLGFDADGNNFVTEAIIPYIKPPVNDDSVGNYICQKYVNCAITKSFVDGDFGVNSSGHVYFRNSAYTTAAAFQTAMSGTILYYQLKTPVTTTIATNLTYNQLSAVRTNGGLLLVNDNNNQTYAQPNVTITENYQYKS